ncbi:stalk domain-containing protein [Brevibacillus sp. B_LB10_24]|uniref:copper amine oxidase N-terminal domain-containing protein n=1 Tax=Brevibacillus sp. B_LB10_24 TaxID=3380645 RepID=UPI0038B884E0
MKRILPVSLAAALIFSAVPSAFAETNVNVDGNTSLDGNGQGDSYSESETMDDSTSDQTSDPTFDTTSDPTSDPTSDTATDPTSDPTSDTATDPTSDPTSDMNNESSPEAETDAPAEENTAPDAADQPADDQGDEDSAKTAEQLSELREQLKNAPEVTEEVEAAYDQLVTDLTDASDLPQAIEVQKELLERTYQPGEHEQFTRLGDLFTQAEVLGVKAFVNGQDQQMDQAPYIQDGRTLVTEQTITAALKAEVNRDVTGLVTITRDNKTITLYLDKKEAAIGEETVALETAPTIQNGVLYLPLRFICEQLGANVDWQQAGQIIIIDDQRADIPAPPTVEFGQSGAETADPSAPEQNDSADTDNSDEASAQD